MNEHMEIRWLQWVNYMEKERKGEPRDYIAEWFKWVEKVGKYLRKHILH
jgi:hypothetical protein